MNNNLSKDIGLLRLNDLNNKIKHLDRKMDILIDNVKYTNIKLMEIHDELFNSNVTSSNIKRNISPIRSPNNDKYVRNRDFNIYEPMKQNYKANYDANYDDNYDDNYDGKYYGNNSSSEENSPRYPNSQILPRKADKTYLGVPTYKSMRRNTNTYLPDINENKKQNKRNKSNIISRRSFDSLNSLNSLK